MICTRRTSDWHGNAFTLSLIGHTSTCEIGQIAILQMSLWNKILVFCVMKNNTSR